MPTQQRPFRFGVQASNASNRSAWVDLARRTEAAGYSCLTMPDHYDGQLAPVPALMTAADATTSLRIGALVWDNDYKHPAVLAKELACWQDKTCLKHALPSLADLAPSGQMVI